MELHIKEWNRAYRRIIRILGVTAGSYNRDTLPLLN